MMNNWMKFLNRPTMLLYVVIVILKTLVKMVYIRFVKIVVIFKPVHILILYQQTIHLSLNRMKKRDKNCL